MSLTILNFAVNLMLLTQFGYLTYLSWLRYRAGKNGLTPYLTLVSGALTILVVVDMCYQLVIMAGMMGDTPVIAALQGIDGLVRVGLLMANTAYFIAIKTEVSNPLQRPRKMAKEYLRKKMEHRQHE